jgi:thioredoxin reductase (NADPH)
MSAELDIAFPTLSAADIAGLGRFGTERAMTAGEILFAEGDRGFCFFVVLAGEIEIVEHSSGVERLIATHPAGTFTGDVDQLTGRAALVSARVREAGRVIQLGAAALRQAVEELPEVGERILKAFLARRALLLTGGFQGVRIIGSRYSPEAHQLRDFATRNQVPFTWIDLEQDAQAESLLEHFGVPASATPVVIARDGTLRSRPTLAEFAHCAGLEAVLEPGRVFDLAIVGAGPAGLAASVYAASEGLATVTFDATAAGGQAGTSSRIENYLGFPAGISGGELTRNALLQAQKFGAQVSVPDRVVRLRLENGYRVLVLESGAEVHARCVLVASGVEYRRLPIPSVADFEGAGVYHAATEMEARICRGDDVVVVGAGNSAGQAIVYLSQFARHVHVVLRGDDLGKSMSRYLVDRVERIENVTVHRACSVAELGGDTRLRSLTLHYGTGRDVTIDASALFLFIGAAPHTSWLTNCVRLDAKGFVLTGDAIPREAIAEPVWPAGRVPALLETSLPGVFAAGDARSGSMKRVSAAVGEGSMAVSLVHAYLGARA